MKPILSALAEHCANANLELLNTASQLSESDLRAATSPSRDSVFRLIQHLVAGEAYFLARCQGKHIKIDQQAIATMESLKTFANAVSAEMRAFIANLDDAQAQRVMDTQIMDRSFRFPIWQMLVQAFMHSAQHRGELSILLSSLGHPLPTSDIIVQFIQQSGQEWFPRK
ncbi:MAG: DinB family protein [Chloroflexi bacterium]|nr:DinB family protein [Chloroflexota bacterium]